MFESSTNVLAYACLQNESELCRMIVLHEHPVTKISKKENQTSTILLGQGMIINWYENSPDGLSPLHPQATLQQQCNPPRHTKRQQQPEYPRRTKQAKNCHPTATYYVTAATAKNLGAITPLIMLIVALVFLGTAKSETFEEGWYGYFVNADSPVSLLQWCVTKPAATTMIELARDDNRFSERLATVYDAMDLIERQSVPTGGEISLRDASYLYQYGCTSCGQFPESSGSHAGVCSGSLKASKDATHAGGCEFNSAMGFLFGPTASPGVGIDATITFSTDVQIVYSSGFRGEGKVFTGGAFDYLLVRPVECPPWEGCESCDCGGAAYPGDVLCEGNCSPRGGCRVYDDSYTCVNAAPTIAPVFESWCPRPEEKEEINGNPPTSAPQEMQSVPTPAIENPTTGGALGNATSSEATRIVTKNTLITGMIFASFLHIIVHW